VAPCEDPGGLRVQHLSVAPGMSWGFDLIPAILPKLSTQPGNAAALRAANTHREFTGVRAALSVREGLGPRAADSCTPTLLGSGNLVVR